MDMDYELQYRDEQIAHLREIVNGTIRAEGKLYNDFGRERWEINISSILTKLIQEAGRWCEYYASDLFIQWQGIEEKLRDGSILIAGEHVFAMYDSGVHHKEWYENHKNEHDYYRAVWFLDITTDNGKIEMVLHK